MEKRGGGGRLVKHYWLTTRVEERVAVLVKKAAQAMGISISEFLRMALLEKLLSLNLLGAEVKRRDDG